MVIMFVIDLNQLVMEIVKYKHIEGACDFELELEVNHRKSVYFICPKCNWTSEFIPIENYDRTDSFNLNPFKVVDESLFEVQKTTKRRKSTSTKRKGSSKVVKLNKGAMKICNRAYSFNYKSMKEIKTLSQQKKENHDTR